MLAETSVLWSSKVIGTICKHLLRVRRVQSRLTLWQVENMTALEGLVSNATMRRPYEFVVSISTTS